MPIDRQLIRRKIKLIAQDLELLEDVAKKPYDEYAGDSIFQAVSERYLERIIGRMIDINFHIVKEIKQFPPSDYYDSFTELGKLKIFSPTHADSIARLAGLRNRLAYEYDEIDSSILYQQIQTIIEEIPIYILNVEHYLESLKP